jgi:hypothetical protein
MADNVKIIVQDTINDIVVNAAVVVETIDINVQAAVDTVDIVANPNNYVVNINRIIGEQVQSDWDQADNQAPDYIKNKPTIPAAQVNSDWDATSGVAEILNKPTIPAAVTKTSDLINDGENGVDPFITAADIPPVTGFVPYTGATDDVNLGTHDLTATQGTFATSGNPDTLTVNHSSGSGKALTITKGGAGEGIYVNKTSGSGNAVTIVGDLEATNLKRTGGTSSQFLKADGSVDSNTYFQLPALTSGSVLFSNGTTIAQDNANLFWNDTNNRLGIGTNAPTNQLTITNSEGSLNPLRINIAGNGGIQLNKTGINPGQIELKVLTLGDGQLVCGRNLSFFSGATEAVKLIGSTKNFLIGTTTDAGYRLDVNGTARVSGTTTITPAALTGTAVTSALDIAQTWNTTGTPSAIKLNVTDTASNGSSFLLDLRVANTQLFGVTKSGFIAFRGAFGSTGALIGTSAGTLNFYHKNTTAAAYGFDFRNNSGAITATSSESGLISLRQTFSPTSGTGIFNAINLSSNLIINQTGGANGITRGLYINPTLTAAADFRAIENSVGKVCLNTTSGNTMIGTTTDAGYKLDVNGTARVQGALTITTGGASITGNVNIASSSLISSSRYQCSTGLFAFGTTFLYGAGAQSSPSVASGSRSIFLSDASWNQTSGTADFASFRITGTINQTGTATGITRGLYINPTLTAAADFRAIEVANGGAYINTTSVQASAILQADSTTQGFLPPRMTTTQKNAIATPAAGLVVYDTDLNQLCTYDGTWGDSPFYQQSLRGVRFFTDFDSSVNFYNLVSLTGGTAAATQRLTNFVPNQTANQIGIAHYQTGTLATGWAMHITEQSANGQQFQFGGGNWMYETYIEVDTLSDATNRFRFVSGFGNVASSGTETNGAFFTYDEGGVSNGTIASPNWQCVTTVGAVRTLTTTSVAVTTTWTKLRIIVNADATEVKFYIDGILVATHTTNIPVLPNRFKVKQMIAKTLGTGNRFVYCDYIFYENNLTTLR